MIVRDFMNTAPAVIEPDADLSAALQLMAERKNRHLVIIDGGGAVTGILSDRDLALYYDPIKMTQERWEEVKVSQIMAPNPIAIGSTAPINDAARLLLREAISALAVVDNGQLVGVLSDRDFTRHFAQSGSEG